MKNHNVIAIDLAKSSFQVCHLRDGEAVLERSFTRNQLLKWLARQPPTIVAIEACGSAHFWARKLMALGHTPIILTPKAVTPYRQGHKTDKNDALAIAIAALQPNLKTVSVKTVEQQGLQGIERIRQHWSDNITATSNMLRGLLYEFGITIPKGEKALKRKVPEILEDGENELPMAFRHQLADIYQCYLALLDNLASVERQLTTLIKQQGDCQKLMAQEGIGPVNALGLYLALGQKGESFKNGREASACIGLTPKQYSTGGVVVLGGIGKKVGNKRLRANLIQGALSVAKVVEKRPPRTRKEAWLKSLIERRGLRRAAVALANKNIRTAWALLHYNKSYQVERLVA